MLAAGDSRMKWTLLLVGMGIEGQSRSFEVMTISRPDSLGDIADLGLTLAEAKRLLAQLQQQIVAEQANTHAAVRPDYGSCGRTGQVKDWQPHRIATLFGEVRLMLPRFLCVSFGCGATGVSWPLHCRSTPELSRLQARLSALMPYRVAADLLQYLLPIVARLDGDITQRLGHCAEQDVIDDALVVEGNRRRGGQQGEDDVEIRHRQQLGLPRFEPGGPRQALTLRAVPVAARVERDGLTSAF
jgi:hypothetical protein